MQDSLSHPHRHTRRLSAAQKQRRDCNVDGDCDCDCDAATLTAQHSTAQNESKRESETAGGMTLSVAQFFRGFAFPLRYLCFPSARGETLRVCAWKCARCLAREILFSMTCCTRAPWQFYSSLSARICNNVPRKTLKERKTYVSQCSAKLKIEVQKNTKKTKFKNTTTFWI